MSAPGIDVVTPCFNYGRYLRSCAASVLAETGLPVRLLIIDDASTDDTAEQARRIADADARVEVISHRRNRGHIATYNEGLEWASSDYVLVLSADDMVTPGALARAVAIMQARPDVAFTYGRAFRFSSFEDLAEMEGAPHDAQATVVDGVAFIRGVCADAQNPVETATAVVRTAVQKRVGGYRPELPHAGDLEMWLRCAAQGAVAVTPHVQALVRFHGGNMRDGHLGRPDYKQRRDAFRSFFDAPGAALPGAGRLRRRAFRSLAEELAEEAVRAVDHGRPHRWMMQMARELHPPVALSRDGLKYAVKRRLAPPAPVVPGRSPAAPVGAPPDARPSPATDTEAPLVSLVISTRDRGDFLPPFLDSLEALRTSRPWEIVIVDNGSTDRTPEILEAFRERSDLPVRLLREERPGLSYARNAGVRAARGSILCFTDDDCYPHPDFLDAVLAVFEDREVGFMGGRILLHDPQDDPVCITTRVEDLPFSPGEFITTGEIQGACMALRREVFDRVGLFDTAFGAGAPLMGAEDCEMVARAAFAGWRGGFYTAPTIRHHHRRRGEGATKITSSYDYSRGAFFAKMILKYPHARWFILKHWYWVTPVFWRPSRRALGKFRLEMLGALHYGLRYARADQLRTS